MANLSLFTLMDRLAEDGQISAAEALDLRRTIFPDGVVSRQEAEALFALNDRVTGCDSAWRECFVEALADHMMQAGEYAGHLDEANVSWFMARLDKTGQCDLELEAALKLMERSESAPDSLSAFVRGLLTTRLAGKPMGAGEVELVRRGLYAASGSGATSVTEAEAHWLFALDAESAGRANDAAWTDLFVKAVLNHLMGRQMPAALDSENMLARQKWLHTESNPSPVAGLGAIFSGGLKGYWSAVRQPSMRERMEAHYEAANANAEEDAELSLAEVAWTVGMTREDGKRTANEEALLVEIRKLENAEAA